MYEFYQTCLVLYLLQKHVKEQKNQRKETKRYLKITILSVSLAMIVEITSYLIWIVNQYVRYEAYFEALDLIGFCGLFYHSSLVIYSYFYAIHITLPNRKKLKAQKHREVPNHMDVIVDEKPAPHVTTVAIENSPYDTTAVMEKSSRVRN
jgi:hypothetical protein